MPHDPFAHTKIVIRGDAGPLLRGQAKREQALRERNLQLRQNLAGLISEAALFADGVANDHVHAPLGEGKELLLWIQKFRERLDVYRQAVGEK